MATIPVYGKITPKEDRATSIYEANDTNFRKIFFKKYRNSH